MSVVRVQGGVAYVSGQPAGRHPLVLPSALPRWERLARTATGIGFGCAAVGNLFGFLPRAGELLPWFADTAWLPPYPWVLHRLLPLAPLVVAGAVALEAAVAAMLLTRRHEPLALALATAWLLGLIPAMGWPYWSANVVVGVVVGWLAVRAARSSDA